MLEASNPDKAKAKKLTKPASKPLHRFWPIPMDSSNNGGVEKSERVDQGEAIKVSVSGKCYFLSLKTSTLNTNLDPRKYVDWK